MNHSSDYAGFIVTFEAKRSKTISRILEQQQGFQDSFSIDDWDLSNKEVFFLSLKKRGKEIEAAVLVQRAHGIGGTGKPKYEFDHQVLINPPITALELQDIIPELNRITSTPSRASRLGTETWKLLIERICDLRPGVASAMRELLSLIDKQAQLTGGTNRDNRLAEQRDGLGMALDIAGKQRKDVLKSIDAARADKARSVLDLFDNLPIHERHLVEHDKVVLERIFDGGYQGASFRGDIVDNEVRVYVSDKTRLETALGTDLIIYQPRWNSLILVQYKLMSNAGEDLDGWHCRLDGQFDKQVKQMELVMDSCPQYSPADPWDFRLCDAPFYFKLCERRPPHSKDDSLVRGMSVSWPILRQYLSMGICLGPNNGRVIGYKNCFRYLNNTEFATMAKAGWLGSSGAGTDYMLNAMKKARLPEHEPIVAVVDAPRLGTADLRRANRAMATKGERKKATTKAVRNREKR